MTRKPKTSGSTRRNLAEDLKEYGGTKGSLHFNPRQPLPRTLVRKLLRARIAEMAE